MVPVVNNSCVVYFLFIRIRRTCRAYIPNSFYDFSHVKRQKLRRKLVTAASGSLVWGFASVVNAVTAPCGGGRTLNYTKRPLPTSVQWNSTAEPRNPSVSGRGRVVRLKPEHSWWLMSRWHWPLTDMLLARPTGLLFMKHIQSDWVGVFQIVNLTSFFISDTYSGQFINSLSVTV